MKPGREDEKRREETLQLRSGLALVILNLMGQQEELRTAIPGLTLVKRAAMSSPTSYVYGPSLSMIVQGSKRVVLGDITYVYDESTFLLTALNLPTVTQVLRASEEKPYLSILLRLDLTLAKQVIANIDLKEPSRYVAGAGMALGPATAPLFDALSRLVALLESPEDIEMMSELLQREFLYRILKTPAAAYLREMVNIDSQNNKVARVIDWLEKNYRSSFRVQDLAAMNGMKPSAFHHHFRMSTAMSPLQYQKHLRLHEARRLLLNDGLDVGTAALEVGYESSTQFTREYRRLFGAPPSRDVAELRA